MATQKLLEAAILKEILFEASEEKAHNMLDIYRIQQQTMGDPLYIVFD